MINYRIFKRLENLKLDFYGYTDEEEDKDQYSFLSKQRIVDIKDFTKVDYLEFEKIECLNVLYDEEKQQGYKLSKNKKWGYIQTNNYNNFNWDCLIENTVKIKYITIKGNLNKFPSAILKCGFLQLLDISRTQIQKLPNNVNLLSALKYLDISYTNITNIPDKIINLKNLEVLKMFSIKIQDFPKGCQQLIHLKYLGLNSTNIKQIPDFIFNLKNLKALYLGQTDIHLLPNEMNALIHLEHLALWETDISELPDWITRFSMLKGLYLGRAKNIKKLPEMIGKLYNLEKFYLDGTSISVLPNSIQELKNLIEINLSYTKIHTLPNFINATKLKCLNLDGLILERIPCELIRENLPIIISEYSSGLNLYNTKLLCQPISLFTHDIEFIKSYYNEEKVHLNEAKVVFLGDGEAGKSHIINRIFHDGEKCAAFAQGATPGIAISKKQYIIDNENICIQFWDFGGQEIMHSMHRFFLTERTLYIIILNSRDNTQDERAKYWLNNIKSFANGCPVILVLNKIDQNISASLNERALIKDYPQIISSIKMSALEDEQSDFDKLITLICYNIKHFDSYAMDFPKSWHNVKYLLQEMDSNYIVDKEYRKICNDNKIVDEQIQNWLLEWFHDLGISFNYRKRDELLGAYMVLKPQWITNAIYIILFNGNKFSRNGIIKIGDIIRLLKKPERAVEEISYEISEVPYIMGVMRRFEISYEFDKDLEFIPMLCIKNEHELAQTFYTEETLEYHMEYEYLPNNVLHKLMIKMCKDIDMRKIWLTGMILYSQDGYVSALIRMHGECIEIYVKSTDEKVIPARDYLNNIRNCLMGINKELNLLVKDIIIYKENGMVEEILYDNLIIHLNSGEKTYFSSVFRKKIFINKILRTVESNEVAKEIARICETEEKINIDNIKNILKIMEDNKLSYERLFRDLTDACMKIRSNYLLIQKGEENDCNTYLRDLLETYGYNIKDQTLRGASPNRKGAGELDLLVYESSKRPYAVIEALKLSSLDKRYIDFHINKTLEYDTIGLKGNYIINYVNVKNKTRFWKNYVEFILNNEYKFPLLGNEINTNYVNVRTIITIHNRDGEIIKLYHIVMFME